MRRLLAALATAAVLAWGPAAFAGEQSHESTDHHAAEDHAHGSAQHADPHHGGGHHGPEPINWTNIWDKERPAYLALVINLGLLIGLYYWFGKKPIVEGLKKRRQTIGKDIDEARKILEEAKERAKKYQADLKNADTDAATAKAALVTAAKGEVERAIAEANERSERMKRDAERLIEQERKQVAHDLLLETVELSLKEAEEVLRKSVTADDHARLAQDLLAELSKAPAAQERRAP